MPTSTVESGPTDVSLSTQGRSVIQDGTSVLGGVFRSRASIIVDVAENPHPYQRLVDAVDESLDKRTRWGGAIDIATRLETLCAVTDSRFMPFNPGVYAEVLKEEATRLGLSRLSPDHTIGLSQFMERGGICHQHALVSAAVLELMQLRGDLSADASIRFKASEVAGLEAPGCHTNTQITFANQEGFIIDTPNGVMAIK